MIHLSGVVMSTQRLAPVLVLGLALAGLSFAPAALDEPSDLAALAEARYQASLKHYDEAWVYYQQSRSDALPLYFWSRLVLEAQGDLSDQQAERLAAFEAHLARMKKLEALVKKVRQLGFGRSIDVTAVDYFRKEAEFWLARAKTQKKPTVPSSF